MGRPPKTNTKINGKDYYRIRRTIDGKEKAFYGKSKGEAEDKYHDYIEEQARKRYEKEKRMKTATIADMASDYTDNVLSVSSRYAEGTKRKYEEAYRCHIKGSSFDKMVASKVTSTDVQGFYNSLDVSKQTMQNINKFMRGFCNWMVRNNYSEDFLTAVEIPKKPDNKRHDDIVVWNDAEVDAILHYLDAPTRLSQRHRMVFLVKTLLYTGMRLGEVLGLKYTDFDEMVTVSRQYTLGEIKPPKYNSVREIPIHPNLKKALEEHKKWHKNEMRKNGYKTDFVFTTDSGNLYNAANVRTALKRLYNNIGVEYKHPHAYRSTFCTNLCKSGVPIQVASNLMGHKNITVTARFYTGIDGDSKTDAINMLNY